MQTHSFFIHAFSVLGVLLATMTHATPTEKPIKTLVLGGGCFWCTEAIYESLNGVQTVESGYAGGHVLRPTYAQVCSGTTGHAEVIKIVYDSAVISTDDLLRIFFTVHDPTTLNRQGNDIGTQYRSVIFFESESEKARAQKIMEEVTQEKIWDKPIVTKLEPLKNYTKAEEYHQNYYDKFEKGDASVRAGMNTGYCQAVVAPKVLKFRQKYAEKLKKQS